MRLKAFKYYLLLPLLSLTKNKKTKRIVGKNKESKYMNIKVQSIQLVQNQSEHIIYQNHKIFRTMNQAIQLQKHLYPSNVSEQCIRVNDKVEVQKHLTKFRSK